MSEKKDQNERETPPERTETEKKQKIELEDLDIHQAEDVKGGRASTGGTKTSTYMCPW